MVPSNYLQIIEDDESGAPEPSASQPAAVPAAPVAKEPEPEPAAEGGATATALYDYEAAEDNELSFPEDATITNVVCTYLDSPVR